MKIHQCDQGTPEWIDLRAGIPTASEFDSILTRGGKRSESRERYMLTLLAERLMGHACHEHVSMWMERGSEEEKRAVTFYEFRTQMETERIGFVTNDEETWGASPDRFVGDVGLLEIKVPSEWVAMGYLLKSGKAYDKYIVQCQGQLMVCEGREWSDVLSWHPELPEALIRIEPDPKFQSLLGEAVSEFSADLENAWASIVADGLATKLSRPVREKSITELLKESMIALQK